MRIIIIRLSEISTRFIQIQYIIQILRLIQQDFEITAQLPILKPDTINNISVSLPVEFGEYLIRDTTKLFYSNTKPDFRSYFKGLYFRISASSDPLMVAFSLVTRRCKRWYITIIILYSYMHDTAYVNQRYYFILDPVHPNACYNKFYRDFSTADPDKKIEHINDITTGILFHTFSILTEFTQKLYSRVLTV